MKKITENIENHILNELSNAKISLDIAVAWITSDRIINLIKEKKEKGIQIRILCWKENNDSIGNKKLNKAFPIRQRTRNSFEIYESENMHWKCCIIDGHTVIKGSYNWTEGAKNNKEYVEISTSKDDVEFFQKEFNKLREETLKKRDNKRFKESILSNSENLIIKTFDEKIDGYLNELSQKNKKFQQEHNRVLIRFNQKIEEHINSLVLKNQKAIVEIDQRIARQNEQINAFEKRTKFLKTTMFTCIILLLISVLSTIISFNYSTQWYKESVLTKQEAKEELLKEFEKKNLKLYNADIYNAIEAEHQIMEDWISKNPKDSRKFVEYRKQQQNK